VGFFHLVTLSRGVTQISYCAAIVERYVYIGSTPSGISQVIGVLSS